MGAGNSAGPEGLIGRVMGGYRLQRILGRGATGAVFLGERLDVAGELAAVKILMTGLHAPADERLALLERFAREAQTLFSLRHPHIPVVHAYGTDTITNYPYVVLPYLRGDTLAERLKDGPLPLTTAADYLAQIASALDYAHGRGIVHRDVKPANVLLDEHGTLYLSDFGIARILQTPGGTITDTGAVLGTANYMAPEQAIGEHVGPAADIYSLGVVLFQMVTGRLPFEGATPVYTMLQHIQALPPSPREFRADLPEAAALVILRALAKNPEERYASAESLAQAFALGIGAPARDADGSTQLEPTINAFASSSPTRPSAPERPTAPPVSSIPETISAVGAPSGAGRVVDPIAPPRIGGPGARGNGHSAVAPPGRQAAGRNGSIGQRLSRPMVVLVGLMILVLMTLATVALLSRVIENAPPTPTATEPAAAASVMSAPSPLPTPIPEPPQRLVFSDDLISDTGQWCETNGDFFFWSDGLHVKDGSWCSPAHVGSLDDFTVSVAVKQNTGDAGAQFGLVLRADGASLGYHFLITDNGSWAFYGTDSKQEFLLQQGRTNALAQGQGAANSIEVRAWGPHIELYINGTEVGVRDDASYRSGLVGIIGAPHAEVVFSHFRVTRSR